MRYYYSKLDDEGREIYRKIYSSIENFEEKFSVKGKSEDVREIYYMIFRDNPMLFYVNPYNFTYYSIDKHVWVEPIYMYTKQEACKIKNKINSMLKKFEAKVGTMSSKLDREKYIHKCLVSNIKYKYDYAEDDIECHTIVGSFIHKQAVCDGISKAFKHLCDLAKINSIVVLGDSWNQYDKPQPHAWNMVKIGKHWYHIDVTWDLNLSERFKYVRYDYFNLREYDIYMDHRNFDKLEICNSLKNNYFYENDCIINNKRELDKFFVDKIRNIKKNNGSKNISFKLYCEDEDAISLIIDSMNKACLKNSYFGHRYEINSNSTQNVYLVRFI